MFKKKLFQLCVELTNGDLSSKTLKKLTKSNLSRLLIKPFAKTYNITYKDLKIYNPWLRDRKLDNKEGKTYYIKILKK